MADEPMIKALGAFTSGQEPLDVNRDLAVIRYDWGEWNEMIDFGPPPNEL